METPPETPNDFVDEPPRVAHIRERLEKFLTGRDYYFNADSDTVESILKAMAKRHEKFGEDYCPCRRVTGDAEKDQDIICPCVFHQDEIKTQGHCHCMLFTTV